MDTQSGESDAHNEAENAKNDLPAQSPVGVNPTVKAERGATPTGNEAEDSCDCEEGMSCAKKWEIGIGSFIAMVNFVALFIYGCQLHQMTKATRAATNGLRLTRVSSHIDQRAWLSVIPAMGIPQVNQKMIVQLRIKNFGKSFARDVRIGRDLKSFKKGEMPNLKTIAGDERTGVIAPTDVQDMWIGSDEVISKEILDATNSGAIHFFIYGRVTYYDIFDCVHWTIFCFAYAPETKDWDICQVCNDADNDRCK